MKKLKLIRKSYFEVKRNQITPATALQSERGFIPLWSIVAIVVLGIGLIGYSVYHNNQTGNVIKAANRPGIIKDEQFSTAVDSQGKATHITNKFSTTDQKVYAVISLDKAKAGTVIQYVRYFNGKNIDDGSLTINKNDTKNIDFLFATKSGKLRHPGEYKVRVYTNGKAEMSSVYTVK